MPTSIIFLLAMQIFFVNFFVNKMRTFFPFLFLMFLLPAFINTNVFAEKSAGIQEPEEPKVKVPVQQGSRKLSQPKHKGDQSKKDKDRRKKGGKEKRLLSLYLCNGESFEAFAVFNLRPLKVRVKKAGIVFTRLLTADDIQEIKILQWQAFAATKKRSRERTTLQQYYFYPSKYAITDKNQKIIIYKQNIPSLNKFSISNDNGRAIIYSFFVDYWKVLKDGNSYWLNSASTNKNYPEKQGLKEALCKVKFY